jgi:hypothetical protein
MRANELTMAQTLTWRKIAVTLRTLNELYKKGCQEQTSASTGGRDDFGLDLQPTVGVSAPRFAEGFCSGRFALAVVFSAGGDNANRV